MIDDKVPFTQVVVDPRRLANQTEAANLREIEMTGRMIEKATHAEIEAFAESDGFTVGEIKGRWIYRAEALGYKMPEGYIHPDADPDEVERRKRDFADHIRIHEARGPFASPSPVFSVMVHPDNEETR